MKIGTGGVRACALLLGLAKAGVLDAQEPGSMRVELGVEPAEVTVGDPFHAAVRILHPPGYRVEFPEFTSGDTLQSVGPLLLADTSATGTTAVYALVAWAAGTPLSTSVPVRLSGPDGSARVQEIRLQLPRVRSVLPAEGEEIAPRPARGPIPPSAPDRLPSWWWLLLLLGALLAALLAYLLLRRRGSKEESEVDPREWALAQLGERGAAGLLAAAEYVAVYERVSWVLRSYIQRVRPDLGMDLTTTEVLARFTISGADAPAERALALLLQPADRVKFARYTPGALESETQLRAALDWVTSYPAPVQPESRRAA